MFEKRVAILSLVFAGCVFPAGDPTGVELSWRFLEANAIDGEESIRARSCAGIAVDQIAVDITDDDTPGRQGIFRFGCDSGYQTQREFQTEASDAFVELDPGPYRMQVLTLAADALFGDAELLEEREVDVADRQVTTELWELVRPPLTWELELTGAEDCGELSLALFYDNPVEQLPEVDLEEGQEDDGLLYRQNLASEDGALRFDGTPTECSAALDATHRVADVDAGAYVLEVTTGSAACRVRVAIGPETPSLPLDLANLPCAG